MQFIEDRPDIPDELITARDNGKVIFICGAGVSRHLAKLPLFECLVEKIYQNLNEDKRDTEPDTFQKRNYDETLWSLEQRIGGRSEITKAIHEILKEPYNSSNVDLKYHKILLELSKPLPILTTNFDTLFEKASKGIKSHYGPAFPDIADEEEFQGIIHLHGRLKDEECSLDNTPLILTLKDFAEAYMREGWAARFLYKIARKYNIVFVGYSAEDYFLKLLLSSMVEDRKTFPDMEKIYAFTKENHKENHKSFWEMFKITPITFKCYGKLYRSLDEWAQDVEDPNRRLQKSAQALSKKPKEVIK